MSATLVTVENIDTVPDGERIRLVARTLAFDPLTQILTVCSTDRNTSSPSIAVDLTVVLDAHVHAAYLRPKSTVMVMGRLETEETRPGWRVLRAIWAKHVDENGFEVLWKESLNARGAVEEGGS